MNLGKFSENRLNELVVLQNLINLYGALYQEEKDRASKNFYLYSIKLAMVEANQIMMGDVKLNTQFKNHFEKQSEGLFKSKLDELEDKLGIEDDDLEDDDYDS